MKIIFHSCANKTHFHKNSCALCWPHFESEGFWNVLNEKARLREIIEREWEGRGGGGGGWRTLGLVFRMKCVTLMNKLRKFFVEFELQKYTV